jgi:hypothetical protein
MRYGWNLEPESWKLLAALLDGLHWNSVPFNELHKSSVPNESGVYLISSEPPFLKGVPFDKFYTVLYAGLSSTSIQSRFIKHCKNPDEGVLKAKKCYEYRTSLFRFHFAKSSPASVAHIESRLIDCFGPPCNKQAGKSTVIKAVLMDGKPAG